MDRQQQRELTELQDNLTVDILKELETVIDYMTVLCPNEQLPRDLRHISARLKSMVNALDNEILAATEILLQNNAICRRCGRPNDTPRWKHCPKCRKYFRDKKASESGTSAHREVYVGTASRITPSDSFEVMSGHAPGWYEVR